jgi:S1-C subfamily serine protease
MRGQRGEIIAGDIIVAMDNKLVTNADEFLEVIERHNAGDTITVTVLRGGTTVELPVKLGPAE